MTSMREPVLGNRALRKALLSVNGLSAPLPGEKQSPAQKASGAERVRRTLLRLGSVQIDSIVAVERAHHHVLFTRDSRYRHEDLKQALETDRTAFENWTHNASVLPMAFYPYWKHYFARFRNGEIHPGYQRYFAHVSDDLKSRVLNTIRKHGPLRPRDISSRKVDWHDPYFSKPSLAKMAMEYLWRTGDLAVTARIGQEKVYDLAENVIPADHFRRKVTRRQHVAWACGEALRRLVAATPAQIARFFHAVSLSDAGTWCEQNLGGLVQKVRVEHADSRVAGGHYSLRSQVAQLDGVPNPPGRLRVLNPFDPLVHDRGSRRTEQIFGFDQRMEIWVPPGKRRYGYYVLPILEGCRFTGRVDVKVERREDLLKVLGLWWEPGVKATERRVTRLRKELGKLAAFVGVGRVVGWDNAS